MPTSAKTSINDNNASEKGSLYALNLGAYSLDELAELVNWFNDSKYVPPKTIPWGYVESNDMPGAANTGRPAESAIALSATAAEVGIATQPASGEMLVSEANTENLSNNTAAELEDLSASAHPDSHDQHTENLDLENTGKAADESRANITVISQADSTHTANVEHAIHASDGPDHTIDSTGIHSSAKAAISDLDMVSNDQPIDESAEQEKKSSDYNAASESQPPSNTIDIKPTKRPVKSTAADAPAGKKLDLESTAQPRTANEGSKLPRPAPMMPLPRATKPMTANAATRPESEDQYLRKLEALVLELNLQLAMQTNQAADPAADPTQWLSQRVIELSLQNMSLQEMLASRK